MPIMKKNIIAKTFTPMYDEVEDRLRVVVNYQDAQNRVDFMITRNFVLNLIPSVDEFRSALYGVDDFESPMQSEAKQKITSKTDNTNLELLKMDEELLREVNFSFDKNLKQTTLTLNSKNSTAKAQLDGFMLMQIFKIIKSAIPYIRWGISHHF